jgi:hypothetical protein
MRHFRRLADIPRDVAALDYATDRRCSAGVQHRKAEPELSVFRDPGALRLQLDSRQQEATFDGAKNLRVG